MNITHDATTDSDLPDGRYPMALGLVAVVRDSHETLAPTRNERCQHTGFVSCRCWNCRPRRVGETARKP